MADANVAPDAPAQPTVPAPSEATPSNTLNEAPQAPAAPVASAAPSVEDPFDRFVNANGGREKVLAKMKQAIGDPVAYARSVLGEQQAPTNQPINAMPEQPVSPIPQADKGFVSPMEIAIGQYGRAIANEYEELGDYVSQAKYMNDMADMGIKTVDQYGNINDNAIRKFLDLKKQAAAPVAPVAPVTATPTVEYYNVSSNGAMTQNDALAIIQQNAQLRAGGHAEHPQTAQAKEFLQKQFASKK